MKAKLMLVIAFALLSVAGFAQGENAALRKQMETFFAKVDKYMVTDNVEALWPLFHPGYYAVDTEGRRMELPAFKDMVNQMRRSSKLVSAKTRIWNVQLQDQEAVAWIQQELVWKEPSGSGNWVSKKSTTRWAENLVRGGPGGWRFRRQHGDARLV